MTSMIKLTSVEPASAASAIGPVIDVVTDKINTSTCSSVVTTVPSQVGAITYSTSFVATNSRITSELNCLSSSSGDKITNTDQTIWQSSKLTETSSCLPVMGHSTLGSLIAAVVHKDSYRGTIYSDSLVDVIGAGYLQSCSKYVASFCKQGIIFNLLYQIF